MTEILKQLMATSATGYGAVIDGVLNVRTISDTPNAAAMNGLWMIGVTVVPSCCDPDCNCLVKLARQYGNRISIVPISVEVVQ